VPPTCRPRLQTGTVWGQKGTRYRYYVSRALITQDQRESATTLRIPAGEIEHLVTSRVRQWLLDPGGIYRHN
jgi:hypothetical protein